MRKLLTSFTFPVILMATLFFAGCSVDNPSESTSRDKGAQTQETAMQRAQAAVPVPQVTNFLTREAVAKWMTRMDQPNKIFYLYLLGDNGNIIGYYTAQNRPTSTCALMTPPDKPVVHSDLDGDSITTVAAPALDGVYYGSSGCDSVFFFEAGSDAYIEVNGFHYITTDQPLKVKAQPLNVAASS